MLKELILINYCYSNSYIELTLIINHQPTNSSNLSNSSNLQTPQILKLLKFSNSHLPNYFNANLFDTVVIKSFYQF